ncbi:hypothetical protein KOR34_00570 [Posidoniimonas corsicana]|uniref:Uncharacterized protein n=1 Tax=Posidoniimonas corsicana TaxID=1938618 RepID=A0A5C5VBG1_9BACT|nr:hypothetical protein [Posidoniimonas corsicana]TWT35169.1 hypothetical protein KOR34_00570 [Posidoniimonas corsicana]
MQIEVSDETGNLVQTLLASGQFSSAGEFIATMAKYAQRIQTLPRASDLPEHVEADQLAQQQGVGPIADPEALRADFWPEGESVEAFVNEIRERRGQDAPRVR